MNNQNNQAAIDSINLADQDYGNLQQTILQQNETIQNQQDQINSLEDQIANTPTKTRYLITKIGMLQPEVLWYVGRSAGAPHTGPHGTENVTLGDPITFDFHPVVLVGGQSDNIYNLWRFANYIPPDVLKAATKFAMNFTFKLNPLNAVQAFESDFQRQLGTVVNNFGLQFLPGNPWIVRGFDYAARAWVPLPGVTISVADMANPVVIRGEFSTDAGNTQSNFDKIIINGQSFTPGISHKVGSKGTDPNHLEYNCAIQLDAKSTAPPYVAVVSGISIELQ